MKQIVSILRDFFRGTQEGLRADQIDTEAGIVDFIATRAAHVAQTSLYGYLRTRMGTREREIFQDEAFAEPLRNARQTMLMLCLSDLTVFAASLVEANQVELSKRWYRAAALAADPELSEAVLDDGFAEFETRLREIDWANAAQREGAFTESPKGLVAAAPVVDDFKELDAEIVTNSVRFRWTDVRRQLRERVNPQAFLAART